MIEEKDILVGLSDPDHVYISSPKSDDTEDVIELKIFLSACIHRRAQDPAFNSEIKLWLAKKVRH